MERFVFVAAVTVAIVFAIGMAFSRGDWFHFEVDGEEGGTAELVQLAPGQLAAQAFEASSIRVRHAAARIFVTAEDRTDYSVEIQNAGHAPMPTVTSEGGRITIDGHLRGRIERCTEDGAELRGYPAITVEQMPVITIRAPRDVDISVGGASRTQIGPANSVELDHSGCGQTTVADVAGQLSVDLAGSGEIRTGAAQTLNADIAGSGQLISGAISESANIDIAGSGSAELAALNGSLEADGAGSGDVVVRGGSVTQASIDLAGSGNVEIAAPVSDLDVSIVGSGDVVVTAVVGNVDAEIAGSGEVRAQSVTGSVRQQVWGSGAVRVGE